MLMTADQIRKAQTAEAAMRETMLDRLVDLVPVSEKDGMRDEFDRLSYDDLLKKTFAMEQDAAQKAAHAHLTRIQNAQKQPLKQGLVPTWPVVNAVADIARITGFGLMRYFNSKAFIRSQVMKADNTPVSHADEEAEGIIRAGLRALAPETPFVGEESVSTIKRGTSHIGADGQFWIVDALDGTKSFMEGYKEWTVNIALIRNGRVALGVVYAPAINRLYRGLPHQGIATVQTASMRERRIEVKTRPPEKRRAVIGYTQTHPATLAAFKNAHGIKSTFKESSTLRMCRLAEGHADIYPQLDRFHEWDVAAATAVVEGAGGVVIGLEDKLPLRFGMRHKNFVLPPMVAASTRAILKL